MSSTGRPSSMASWARRRDLPGATVEVVRIAGLTPTVLVDVPATDPGADGHRVRLRPLRQAATVHRMERGSRTVDAHPRGGPSLRPRASPTTGTPCPPPSWPWRRSRAAGGRHARCVVLAEGSEESGSPHLRPVLAALAERIGTPDLVIALDSSAPTGERLWVTTSLRGALMGELTVRVLDHGVHSGSAGAVVPSSFRIARLLLDRIEDPATGDLRAPRTGERPLRRGHGTPPSACDAALTEAGDVEPPFPTVEGLALQGATRVEQAMRKAWLGSVAVVGADGLPASIGRRSRAPSVHHPEAGHPAPSDLRRGRGRRGDRPGLHHRSALRRRGDLGRRAGGGWLGGAGLRPVAVRRPRPGLRGGVRPTGGHGRGGGHHPLRRLAGRAVPATPRSWPSGCWCPAATTTDRTNRCTSPPPSGWWAGWPACWPPTAGGRGLTRAGRDRIVVRGRPVRPVRCPGDRRCPTRRRRRPAPPQRRLRGP